MNRVAMLTRKIYNNKKLCNSINRQFNSNKIAKIRLNDNIRIINKIIKMITLIKLNLQNNLK